MKTLLFVLLATILEATGDAILRVALHQSHGAARVALFFAGAIALTLYGTSLNLAPVEFAQITGIYLAVLFIVFQVTNYLFFKTLPTSQVFVGGSLIVCGGLIVGFWK